MARDTSSLNSVHNALRILKCFSIAEPEHRVSALARKLELNKSTVSRLLTTLENEGFVVKDPISRAYRLGLPVLSLASTYQSCHEVLREAHPLLKNLVNRVEETVQLVLLDHVDVFYLEVVECNHPIRFISRVGTRCKAYCTSSGKVLLSGQDSTVIDEVINAGLKRWTKNTITDPQLFRIELENVRRQGYALSQEERHEGVVAAAAPIYDAEGNVAAALNIVGPRYRMAQKGLLYFANQAIHAAKEISHHVFVTRP